MLSTVNKKNDKCNCSDGMHADGTQVLIALVPV